MTVYRLLADIVDALRTSHLEHEAIRREMASEVGALREEMATKAELAALREEMATKAELAALREEMATKKDLAALREEVAGIAGGLRKLGLEFEAFRHDCKIALEALAELMLRTDRHEKAIANLDRRTSRVEQHLRLAPLPDEPGNL